MKITVLCENYVKSKGLLAEHGLSLYVEYRDKKILFDMGQRDVFLKNSEKLGVSLDDISFAILSHGHYDHGGGAKAFLERFVNIPLYINSNAFGEFYSQNGYIGLDKTLLENQNVILTDGAKLCEGVTLIPSSSFEMKEKNFSKGLKKKTNSGLVEDDFLHEQYLLVEENGKKILISGCSHRGILNVIEYFKPQVFIGGLHLSSIPADSEELLTVAKRLLEYDTRFYVCHCTGLEQFGVLKSVLLDKCEYIYCGKNIIV